MYSRKFLMMGREDARNMFQNKIWIISASGWLFKNKSITMHGNINVKLKVRRHCELPPGIYAPLFSDR